MGKKYPSQFPIPISYDVQKTAPFDNRIVVESVEDLLTFEYPYQGMVVNVAGTSDLYILQTEGKSKSKDINNWKKVSGSSSSSSAFGIPTLTPEMVDEFTENGDIDFNKETDPYILLDDGSSLNGETTTKTITSVNGTYLDIMMRSIRALQAEVARLKNSFEYGIDSYQGEKTAKSVVLGEYEDVIEDEPLWAIDPGYLSMVSEDDTFNYTLDSHHSFHKIDSSSDTEGSIDVSVDGQLTFNNCVGVFTDCQVDDSGDSDRHNYTLYNLKDSKLITYLVTDKPNIKMNLISIDDENEVREIDFSNLLGDNTVKKYGYCVVLSRKSVVKDTTTNPATETQKGFNYIYFSIINYENDKTLLEGYLHTDGTIVENKVEVEHRYSIDSIEFDNLTLSKLEFYTKYEDFKNEVISSAPSEKDFKYEVSHITIRAVETREVLEKIKQQLKENELVWCKNQKALYIKSDNKIQMIGSNANNNNPIINPDNNMTNKEIIAALKEMGIVINVKYKQGEDGEDTDEILSVDNMSLAPISDFSFVNTDTGKKFTYSVDSEGNLVGKDNSVQTIEEFMTELKTNAGDYDKQTGNVRGFISDYLFRRKGIYDTAVGVNKTSDTGLNSDRLRFSAIYAPLSTDKSFGCTHSFIELENSSDIDIPLTGVYLHMYDPAANNFAGAVYHLELDGVIKAGGTYLIRGAKHAEFDDESAFIKVATYDKEWFHNGKLVSFMQTPGDVIKASVPATTNNNLISYRFCLTYGLKDLKRDDVLVEVVSADQVIGSVTYSVSKYPNKIVNPRFIDCVNISSVSDYSKLTNGWYCNGTSGVGITITENSMFRVTFALDPAKQAYTGFNTSDSSRVRYNKASDIQILKLNKEFIGYPFSDETINIDRYTPKASFENKNIMTDKTQLDNEKPNMVTCSFGSDVYNTRCFNWISCGVFDEYLWVRKQGDSTWNKFQSYTTVSTAVEQKTTAIHRKEYSVLVNNTAYARMINRFPGNDVLFTSHKCIIELADVTTPTVYEYVVGRPDKDGQPDDIHTNDTYTFTLYPRDYEGRVYQITDQQGFYWIEYQVWAASAKYLNEKIASEISELNEAGRKVFPILINTGDMTQSGARINEWLDYYNGGQCLFSHMEQINCVGNNDLCGVNVNALGTGNDYDKSNSHFFHYFYCFDVKNGEFSGDDLIVPAHGTTPARYIPSTYCFETKDVMYIICNSEITKDTCNLWYNLKSSNDNVVNIYTGIEILNNGVYDKTTTPFTPIYEIIYGWLKSNKDGDDKKVVVAMHEMPFTVITKASLTNTNAKQLPCTRNHPTAGARLGSNMNQLDINENRGIFWASRLLESFNCKLVIGGHKHTYALSYPIKEKYSWTYDSVTKDSKDETKPMSATLQDESGVIPTYEINWGIELSDDNRTEYNVSTDKVTVSDLVTLNSTKTPYIPKSLYDAYGSISYENGKSGIFRCCSPIEVTDNKFDGFVNYSMCQATGYKLKSNKELPSKIQVFSKIIPQTTHKDSGDSPSAEQLYPMYSVLDFNESCSEVDVMMCRIAGIFSENGKDTFTQTAYGKDKSQVKNQYLCTFEKEDCNTVVDTLSEMESKKTTAVANDLLYCKENNKVYKFIAAKDTTPASWTELDTRMYGKWLNESVMKARLASIKSGSASDNRYLHIVF